MREDQKRQADFVHHLEKRNNPTSANSTSTQNTDRDQKFVSYLQKRNAVLPTPAAGPSRNAADTRNQRQRGEIRTPMTSTQATPSAQATVAKASPQARNAPHQRTSHSQLNLTDFNWCYDVWLETIAGEGLCVRTLREVTRSAKLPRGVLPMTLTVQECYEIGGGLAELLVRKSSGQYEHERLYRVYGHEPPTTAGSILRHHDAYPREWIAEVPFSLYAPNSPHSAATAAKNIWTLESASARLRTPLSLSRLAYYYAMESNQQHSQGYTVELVPHWVELQIVRHLDGKITERWRCQEGVFAFNQLQLSDSRNRQIIKSNKGLAKKAAGGYCTFLVTLYM